MSKRDDFDREPEFDFDPDEILDEESSSDTEDFDFSTDFSGADTGSAADQDDLDDLLSDDFLASLGIERKLSDTTAPQAVDDQSVDVPSDTLPDAGSVPGEDDDVKPYTPAAEPAFELEPELGEEFAAAFEKEFPSEEPQDDAQAVVPVVEVSSEEGAETAETPRPRPRRKKLSRERIIKEVYLPPIILALTLILVVCFIGSAVSRVIKANNEREESLNASKEAVSTALDAEANELVAQATLLAAGYDYDGAIAVLDTFSADKAQYQQLLDAYNAINQAKSKIKPIDDPNSIPNLSFHCLIADPSRAFTDKDWGESYNSNYVTTDEFSKILEQLYANGYVLVDFDSFIVETEGEDGKITYSTQPIYLPEGKKPIMLTETLVNYETFSIDGDGDGEPDKDGDGFASKLVVDANGNIVNEMVDADGNTVYGAYDLVPILEAFIKEHPDFCYRGARATLAVSGEDGVFGYRTMHSVKESKGEDYYNEQVEGAKKIAAALREAGYTIACYTYSNVSYGQLSATKIEVDLDNWKKEVKPVLGDVPVLVYAKASDISADGNYEGGKYNVLKNAGFRYFISSGSKPYAEVTVNYVRQSRIMVTGNAMTTTPNVFADFFTVKDVLSDLRGS